MSLLKFFMSVCLSVGGGEGRAHPPRHSKAKHSTRSVGLSASASAGGEQTVQVRKTPLWNRKDGRTDARAPQTQLREERRGERQKAKRGSEEARTDSVPAMPGRRNVNEEGD